jgi:hypothetical protein
MTYCYPHACSAARRLSLCDNRPFAVHSFAHSLIRSGCTTRVRPPARPPTPTRATPTGPFAFARIHVRHSRSRQRRWPRCGHCCTLALLQDNTKKQQQQQCAYSADSADGVACPVWRAWAVRALGSAERVRGERREASMEHPDTTPLGMWVQIIINWPLAHHALAFRNSILNLAQRPTPNLPLPPQQQRTTANRGRPAVTYTVAAHASHAHGTSATSSLLCGSAVGL